MAAPLAASEALDLCLGTRLERRGNDWVLITSGGDVIADQVVVATGYANERPGLRFIGFVPVPGQIRRMSADARRVARDIARHSGAAWGPSPRRALSSG